MRFDRKSHKYVINNAYVINNDPLACRFSSLMPFEEMQRYSSYICALVHAIGLEAINCRSRYHDLNNNTLKCCHSTRDFHAWHYGTLNTNHGIIQKL